MTKKKLWTMIVIAVVIIASVFVYKNCASSPKSDNMAQLVLVENVLLPDTAVAVPDTVKVEETVVVPDTVKVEETVVVPDTVKVEPVVGEGETAKEEEEVAKPEKE